MRGLLWWIRLLLLRRLTLLWWIRLLLLRRLTLLWWIRLLLLRRLTLLWWIRLLLLRRLTLLWWIWLLLLRRLTLLWWIWLLRIGLFRSGLLPWRRLLSAGIGRRHGSLGVLYGYRSGYRGDIFLPRGGGGPGAGAAAVDDLHTSDEENILVTQNPAVGLLAAVA